MVLSYLGVSCDIENYISIFGLTKTLLTQGSVLDNGTNNTNSSNEVQRKREERDGEGGGGGGGGGEDVSFEGIPSDNGASATHPSLADSVLTAAFPPAYYSIDEKIKIPKGSQLQMRLGTLVSLVVAMISFALLCYYFSTLSLLENIVSGVAKEGYNCTILRPKVGVKYLSPAEGAENAQYTGT